MVAKEAVGDIKVINSNKVGGCSKVKMRCNLLNIWTKILCKRSAVIALSIALSFALPLEPYLQNNYSDYRCGRGAIMPAPISREGIGR